MTIKEIITAHLLKVGATGLCGDGCGCRLPQIIPCYSVQDDCVPAVEGKCGPECVECGGEGCMTPLVEASVEKQEPICGQEWRDNRSIPHACNLTK